MEGILTVGTLCKPNGLRWCAAIWFRIPPLGGSSQVSDRMHMADTGPREHAMAVSGTLPMGSVLTGSDDARGHKSVWKREDEERWRS
jgi:hypothetical protein